MWDSGCYILTVSSKKHPVHHLLKGQSHVHHHKRNNKPSKASAINVLIHISEKVYPLISHNQFQYHSKKTQVHLPNPSSPSVNHSPRSGPPSPSPAKLANKKIKLKRVVSHHWPSNPRKKLWYFNYLEKLETWSLSHTNYLFDPFCWDLFWLMWREIQFGWMETHYINIYQQFPQNKVAGPKTWNHPSKTKKQAFRTGVLVWDNCIASTVMMCQSGQSGIITLLIHANPLVTRENTITTSIYNI